MKGNTDIFTLIHPKTGKHYDTYDQRFYDQNWDRTKDSKKYLEGLKKNYPEKFGGFRIVENA